MKRGVTLSELLVVMAVMLILAVGTFPAVKAIRASLGAADDLPVILQHARTAAMQSQRYAGVALVQQADGKVWAFVIVEDQAHAYTPQESAAAAIALVTGTVEGLHYKPRPVSGYAPAVALYNKQGHACPGRNLLVDNLSHKSVDAMDRNGTMRYLHRYQGGFVR